MQSLNSLHNQSDTPNTQPASPPVDVASLYDQYAASLLGVISRMVNEREDAVLLLEKTFTQIRAQIGEFNPDRQLLFAWLLNVARANAREAIQATGRHPGNDLHLTGPDNLVRIGSPVPSARNPAPADGPRVQLKQLLDCVLFENCTPEEAAASAGIPVEEARQQLRRAMQTLRVPR